MSCDRCGFYRGLGWLAVTLLLASFSELLLKQGAADTAHRAAADQLFGISALDSRLVWGGIVLQIIGFISYGAALRTLPLYVAFNSMSLLHVTIPVCAWLALGEGITATRWAGIALVVLGVWLIARSAAAAEDSL